MGYKNAFLTKLLRFMVKPTSCHVYIGSEQAFEDVQTYRDLHHPHIYFSIATVHSLMRDTNSIDSCQTLLFMQNASNPEIIRQK